MDLVKEADRYWDAKDDRVDQERLSLLLSLVPRGARVLVVDGGPGMLAERLQHAGFEVCMTEVSAHATARALAKGLRAQVCDTDTQSLPFPDAHFTCVISDSAIEHRFDHIRVFTECARVLAPGGIFLLLVPNIAHWRHRLQLLCGRWPEVRGAASDRCHLRFFALPELRALMRQHGFHVQHTTGYAALWVKGLWPSVCRAPGVKWIFSRLARAWPALFARDLLLSATKNGLQRAT
ncbi:MAG: class I SAM-dependent methyltransferase [Planctomycetes bacterium]|nr:class I SAM-dependent methyltransferase [Planctomycetota bacterium]